MEKISESQSEYVLTYVPTVGDLAGRVVRLIIDSGPLRQTALLLVRLWIHIYKAFKNATFYFFPGSYVSHVVKKWREEHPDVLPSPPENGIQVGLPNLGNTCWFNSLLKFMAATNYFDAMLVDTGDEEKDRLRHDLSDLFIYLRSCQSEHLLYSAVLQRYFDRIVDAIVRMEGFGYEEGEQCDPSEFLQNLVTCLGCGSLSIPVVKEYNTSCKKMTEIRSPLLSIDVPEEIKETDSPIDLETEAQSFSPIDGGGVVTLYPSKLSDELICVFKRFDQIPVKSWAETPWVATEKGKEKIEYTSTVSVKYRKHTNPIKMTNGEVCIPVFPSDLFSRKHKGVEDIYHYKVLGSVIHLGRSIDYGHYVATELAANGNHLEHNDELIKPIRQWEEVNAYILRLVRIP